MVEVCDARRLVQVTRKVLDSTCPFDNVRCFGFEYIHEWIYLCASYISLLKYGNFPLSQSDFIRRSISPRDFPNRQSPISLLSCSFTHSQPQSIQALTGSSSGIFIHHEAHSLFAGFPLSIAKIQRNPPPVREEERA